MATFFIRLTVSCIATALFLLIIRPIMYGILLHISYKMLDFAEYVNTRMKDEEHFLGSLKWMAVLMLCSFGLIITTSMAKLFRALDIFGIIDTLEKGETKTKKTEDT